MRHLQSIALFGLLTVLPIMDGYAAESPDGINYGVSFQNGGDDAIGPNYLTGHLHLENKLGYGEKIKLETTNSSDLEELLGVEVGYEQPFSVDWELKLNLFNGSWSRPGGHSGEFFNQENDDYSFGASINRTYAPNDKFASLIILGFQTQDVTNKQRPRIAGFVGNNYKQKTRDIIASVAVEYSFSDNTGLYSDFAVVQGVDWFNPEHFRSNVDDTPTVLRYNGEFTHNLSTSFQIVIRGTLQWTPDRLNQLKMFSLGGWEYASGYRGGESSGDIGGGARIELNRVGNISLGEATKLYYKPFVFIDGGFTRVNDPINDPRTGEDEEDDEKASAGVGLALETEYFHASVQVAYPLSGRSVFKDADDPRILFSVGLRN